MESLYPGSIILASRSPRRRELLSQIGVKYDLLDIEIDESFNKNEMPLEYVERMAIEKAKAGWVKLFELFPNSDKGLLAADTSVVLQQTILGKPRDLNHAREMLNALSDNTHQVITSVALIDKEGLNYRSSVTQVTFAALSESTISSYLATGEGNDKAGSYGIQGLAAKFVKSINGSYSGVVGLPLYETSLLLDNHFKVAK